MGTARLAADLVIEPRDRLLRCMGPLLWPVMSFSPFGAFPVLEKAGMAADRTDLTHPGRGPKKHDTVQQGSARCLEAARLPPPSAGHRPCSTQLRDDID